MVKYFLLVFILIAGGITVMYFVIGVPSVEKTDVSFLVTESSPHFFEDPVKPIKNVAIFGFYFMPKNKRTVMDPSWKENIMQGLEKLKNFHALQFRNESNLRHEIYPEPVVGYADSAFYDTEHTQSGNPRALISIAEELEKRVFKSDGDLHNPNFKRKTGEYPVLAIFYEGVGAAGGTIHDSELNFPSEISEALNIPESTIFILNVDSVDGLLLLNIRYISGTKSMNGDSILAHEFYHTLGVPDGYSHESGIAESADLMGLGRLKPLANTYLSKETLAAMGL